MDIWIAERAGFCYGVKRALEIVEEQLKQNGNKKVYILGPLIHNPQINQRLAEKGLLTVKDLEEVEEGILIIPSHGVSPRIIREIQEKGIEIKDATCPHVRRVQQLADDLDKEGYQVVIIGEANHTEVKGIWGHTRGKGVILENLEQLDRINLESRLGVVIQTTQNAENLKKITAELVIKSKEVRIYNTICQATKERQKATDELAKNVDLMIVIGGYNSANTKRLAEICRQAGVPEVYHIETFEDLNLSCLKGKQKIGITAGASTPEWVIREIEQQIITWREAK